MGGESPVVEIYDVNGNPLAVANNTAIPANTSAILAAGSDGTNAHYVTMDSSGRIIMVGAGTAGTPAGGVITIQGSSSGTAVPVSGTISASQIGNIDAGNSSTTTLAGNGTFTGTGIDVSVYGVVTVFVFTDQAGTLNLEWSINNSNWDDVNSYSVSASTALSIQFGPQARYFRVVYQNGSVAQGTFRLQTIERPITAFPETVPASYTISNSDNVLLTKTVQGTSPWVTNITQFGGNNVVTGTGASGVGIPRVTVSNDSNILATQSGTWTVAQGSANTLANAWPVEVTDGTNILGTSSHPIRIDPTGTTTQPVSGTVAATQGTSPWVTNVTQFGNNNVVTGTGASGVGIPRVTVSNDSNILATQSGTWTVAQGSANTLANAWPTKITDATNGPAAVKAASTAAVAADPALVVAISPNNTIPTQVVDTTATGALGSNGATVQIATQGQQVVGFQLAAGSLIGTVVPESSIDGGTTWESTFLVNNAGAKFSSLVYPLANPLQTMAFSTIGGTSHVRVRVSAYTSGTANATLRGTQYGQDVLMSENLIGGVVGTIGIQVAGSDGSLTRVMATDTSGRPNIVGAAASGSAVAGNPVLVAAKNPSGNVGTLISDAMNSQIVSVGANQYNVQSNATVTSNGSSIISTNDFGTQQISLIINITANPTGTTPTLTYTLQEVDPGNLTTTMGNSSSSTALNSTGVTVVTLPTTTSNVMKVSWVISGSSASFTGVYTTIVTKNSQTTQQTSSTASAANTGVSFGRVLYGGTSGVLTAVRATTYTEQTTNFTGSVKSTSTNDASAGTGARTVTITYYDQTGAGPNTETVTLNGTTAVNLVNTNHCFIEKIVVTTVGSTGSNQGTISLFTGAAGAGTTVGSIGVGNQVPAGTVGDNTTLWAHHYTPVGKTSSYFLFNVGSNGNQAGNYFLRSQAVLTANAAEVQITDSLITAASSDSVSRDLVSPAKVTGFARTTAYVVSSGTNTNFFAGFDFSDA